MLTTKRAITLALFLILLCLATAQAAGEYLEVEKRHNPGLVSMAFGYFRDRALDFLDIFRLRLSMAKGAEGLGIHGRATALAQIGAIYFNGEHFGLDRRGVGLWREKRWEGGISLFYFSDIRNEIIYGNRFTRVDDPWTTFSARGIVRNEIGWDDGRYHPFSIGAEVQLGILPGIDIGLYPLEAVDFIVGFFTLDPFDDDLLMVEKTLRLEEPEKSPVEIELESDLEQMIKTLEEKAKEITPEEEEEEG